MPKAGVDFALFVDDGLEGPGGGAREGASEAEKKPIRLQLEGEEGRRRDRCAPPGWEEGGGAELVSV